MSLTDQAHRVIEVHCATRPRKLAVDATCGNGFDTEFLTRIGFDSVVGFDIQCQAIEATKLRLKAAGLKAATLVHSGHENLGEHINSPIDCAMFNFGYLPKADKNLTTKTPTSLAALKTCSSLLADTGIITMMCYPGHPQGKEETQAIEQWLRSLNDNWSYSVHLAESPKPTAPILFSLTRNT